MTKQRNTDDHLGFLYELKTLLSKDREPDGFAKAESERVW